VECRAYSYKVIQGGKALPVRARAQRRADYWAGAEYVRYRQRQQAIKARARKLAFIKQRFYGLAAVLVGIASVPLLDMDATAALLIVPLGLYMIFSRQLLSEVE
jgi:hypothetical protein